MPLHFRQVKPSWSESARKLITSKTQPDDRALLPVLVEPRTADTHLPAPIADQGETAAPCYVEFFTADIRNPNTRQAYAHASFIVLSPDAKTMV